jgi:hypothetical protein
MPSRKRGGRYNQSERRRYPPAKESGRSIGAARSAIATPDIPEASDTDAPDIDAAPLAAAVEMIALSGSCGFGCDGIC